MMSERAGPSGNIWIPKLTDTGHPVTVVPGGRKPAQDFSVKKGEEFCAALMKEYGSLKNTTTKIELPRKVSRYVQNIPPAYEELTGILGLKRIESGSDISSIADERGHTVENEGFCLATCANYKEKGEGAPNSFTIKHDSYGTITNLQDGCQANIAGTLGISHSEKPKFLCSFGGRILPRPNDGKLRYVGGDTRIITVRVDLSWKELIQKTFAIFPQPHIIKYQLPGEDLDALVSVSSDEDLQNMMEEYGGLENIDGPQKLRLFLISSNESENSSFDMGDLQSDSGYQYIVAVNNMAEPSPRRINVDRTFENAAYPSDNSPRNDAGDDIGTSTIYANSPASLFPNNYNHGNNVIGVSGKMLHAGSLLVRTPSNVPILPSYSSFSQDNDAENAQTYNKQKYSLFPDQLHESSYAADFLVSAPSSALGQYVLEKQPFDNAQNRPRDISALDVWDGGKMTQEFEGLLPSKFTEDGGRMNVVQDNRGTFMVFDKAMSSKFVQEGVELASNRENCDSNDWPSEEGPALSDHLLNGRFLRLYQQEPIDSQDGVHGMQGHVYRPGHVFPPLVYTQGCIDNQVKALGMQGHVHLPIQELHPPLSYVHKDGDLEGPFCRPPQKDQAFHSENFQRHQEELLYQQTRLNNLPSTSHGVPHAYSDSVSQEHGITSYGLQISTPDQAEAIHPLQHSHVPQRKGFYDTSFQECSFQQSLKATTLNMPNSFNNDIELSGGPHNFEDGQETNEKCYKAPYVLGSQCIRSECVLGKPAPNLTSAKVYPSNGEAYPQSIIDKLLLPIACEGDATPSTSLYSVERGAFHASKSSELLNSSALPSGCIASGYRTENNFKDLYPDRTGMIKFEVPRFVHRTSTDSLDVSAEQQIGESDADNHMVTALQIPSLFDNPAEVPGNSNKQKASCNNHNDEAFTDEQFEGAQSNMASGVRMELPLDVLCDKEGCDRSNVLASVNHSPLEVNGGNSSSHIHQDHKPGQPYVQNLVIDEVFKRQISLVDSIHGAHTLEPSNIELDPESNENLKHVEPRNNVVPLPRGIGPEVIIEDVTGRTSLDIISSSTFVRPAYHEVVSDVRDGGVGSPKETDIESVTACSEYEEGSADDHDMDDAAIAEMEAGIYGLQIIRNADLEELRELGSGTFGTVYHGKWRGTDVAIKRIKKSCFAGRSSEQERLTEDFWREARILSKLHHPNVVAFYGVVPDGIGGTLATVTEYMVNGSLRHVLLRKDRVLDLRRKLIIAMDAAFGMEYLHSKNIVHFDLKCDNLLVNMRDVQRPICKVGDFGLSRIKRNTLISGGVRGTLPWMAPELLNGSSSGVSEKVDVFSFGIALWEILTGEEPYSDMHCGAIIVPDWCEPEWRKLMEECWSPEPGSRPSFKEITCRLRTMAAALQGKGSNVYNPAK
ncbi:uncharacterized protein LOC116265489 isoform X2 [Nymphaea colorata]|uniref:uncharacterized protein LOC116265489 isoform X2 n=1 Tax=Nymphaea colorata TaxID=210225 RepID=UPI00129D9798|nr:uncharacterized protein LOC116265489 isoform X2 [Nymphaea colorata]